MNVKQPKAGEDGFDDFGDERKDDDDDDGGEFVPSECHKELKIVIRNPPTFVNP